MIRLRMLEQADTSIRTGEPIYSWILEAPYASRGRLMTGWKWVKGAGCSGCFVTNEASLALAQSTRLGLPIESNGTHAVHNVPLSRAAASSVVK